MSSLDPEKGRVRQLEAECARLRAEIETYRTWVPPGHFYSPVPDVGEVGARLERILPPVPPASLAGIDLNVDAQIALVRELAAWYGEEPFGFEKRPGRRYWADNPYYGYGDGFFLYAMMRRLRPARVIEVGSGYSSCLMLDVGELVLGGRTELTFVEPYPDRLLDLLPRRDLDRVRFLRRQVQDVPLEEFERLEARDVLFVDSSHVSKAGSDVNYLFFEVLPALAPGVRVHVHDVFFPFEYPPPWLQEGRAWNEAYLLRAFLQFNRAFSIELFTTQLAYSNWQEGERVLPNVMKALGGSIWLRREPVGS